MKGYRRLRAGQVIKEGDGYFDITGKFIEFMVCIGLKASGIEPSYRPLTKKPVEEWTVKPYKHGEAIIYHVLDGKKAITARVWSLRDARLIVKAVNQYLAEVGRNG